MPRDHFISLLTALKEGKSTVEEVASHLEKHSFLDMGGVTVDIGRRARTGAPEVVYGESKDAEQLESLARCYRQRNEPLLVTRVKKEHVTLLQDRFPEGEYNARSRTFSWYGNENKIPTKENEEMVIISAGASDAPVAEEVAETAKFIMNEKPKLVHDCGVAGIHRLLNKMDTLEKAKVVIAVAGMDGVLPTVIAGLIKAPIIAVPTSVGYGPGGGGLTPLLTMLSSCAPGLVVVNVDNGVGAAFAAARILGALEKKA